MSAAAASTNGPTTGSDARASGSACSPKTNAAMNVASRTKPIQSTDQLRPASRCTAATLAEAMPVIASSMSKALSQKIARQPVT